MKNKIRHIGVFTSGGDAPGMNAAIRAVVRTCCYKSINVSGIFRGFSGLIDGESTPFTSPSVGNIIQRGGTILQSARSKEFMTHKGMEKAWNNVKALGLDALVGIGGDGTFHGLLEFSEKYKVPVIGIPGTIDNDLAGTDYTIGYDTACNTALELIDKIRDTASSHSRLFFIEVMGRDAGFIAMRCALGAGAEAVLLPEQEMSVEQLVKKLETGAKKHKTSSIVIVAEGGTKNGTIELAKQVEERFSYYNTRVTILGHIQRGGNPSVFDRELASRMGVAAVEGLLEEKNGVMVGIVNDHITYTKLEEALAAKHPFNENLLRVAQILST